ncbi:hypothetical protein PK98_15680 [Croceibacterium mercuriale]|uniref:TNase-like domain-containing protein n=1 Tax=Croceibacterium mercuriale TaxID=1572751 RepID=A0A0B2BWC2_9SPHN|nr:thermonuclease family protein [Croceibacterium mercuriale]KHL24122.1 hypothetical protein PK98_15680 [Croceibacterium mercuriale]
MPSITKTTLLLAAAIVGAVTLFTMQTPSNEGETVTARFELCRRERHTCVVDGDTFWLNGEKYRIADIDTPEISRPDCARERQLGHQAKERMLELLNAGPFELQAFEDRDADRYGRLLRVVVRDGKSLGDQLVSEGLARTWTGRREPWCS